MEYCEQVNCPFAFYFNDYIHILVLKSLKTFNRMIDAKAVNYWYELIYNLIVIKWDG